MPDKRTHRGAHPDDERLFAPEMLGQLQRATRDLSWLLTRGYAARSSLKLVGDHFCLTQRQRSAVMRCACSDQDLARRREKQMDGSELAGQPLLIDGYNLLTTIEAALAGGIILQGRDGTYRDLAAMHGTYRKVAETMPALELIGQYTAELGVKRCRWYLDRPVSNSGRLRNIILELAGRRSWPWEVELSYSPDHILAEAQVPSVSSDSEVLNRTARWVNLAREITSKHIPQAHVIDLSPVD